jgi:hypothetical protein
MCSAENPAPERKAHMDGHHFIKFNVKTNLKLKINLIGKYFEFQIYPAKPSVGLPNLVPLSL